ncbi:hypothetical protein [Streptomyces minutiscleroticus]|uniref:Uncharacterized protein n=1 Tax=Streptomyces minutiscleroticus TaxID=68238 RepID=A0A918UAI6_9ACTN|nr:hypothetical protein [Streptomyces minutiscleroticus]GGY16962.1 hypothetical protein GCM10010358_80710 [Streptomyces minutiscleroticus]
MDSPDDGARRRSLLIASLTVVAADASAQMAWVDQYQMVTDEIALDFEHAFRCARGSSTDLDQDVLAYLSAIDVIFDDMSGQGQADCWSSEAVAADLRWSEARTLARQALLALVGAWCLPIPKLRTIE